MVHATARKFGHPDTLLRDYAHWWLLVRPAQVTLGSLVLVAKGEAEAFGNLDPAAHAELAVVTRDTEALLRGAVDYQRINYLMLMMVDPHVHFHIIPRYEGERSAAGLTIADAAWPGPPDLGKARRLSDDEIAALRTHVSSIAIV